MSMELKDLLFQSAAPNIKEGAQCLADPLDGGSSSMTYAQRFVNPETCDDLLRYDADTFSQWSNSRSGYVGSFDSSFGSSPELSEQFILVR